MANFKEQSKTAKPEPRYIPDWQRIQRGEPFTTRGLDPEQMTPIKPPLEVKSRGAAQDILAQHGLALYPYGPYELRAGTDGKMWLMHTEWHRRAGLWQYQTDTQKSEAVEKFRDPDYELRTGQAYDKGERDA